MQSRRQFLARSVGVGGTLLVGGALAACGSSDDSTSTSPTTSPAASATSGSSSPTALKSVDLQLSWLDSAQFAGSYIADEKGYYAANGWKSTLTPGGPNAPVDPPVVQGTALAGLSAADYA